MRCQPSTYSWFPGTLMTRPAFDSLIFRWRYLRLSSGDDSSPIVSLLLIAIAASMSYEADAVFQGGKMSLIALALLIVSQSLQTFGICYASTVLARKFQISEGGPQGGTASATSEISEIFR